MADKLEQYAKLYNAAAGYRQDASVGARTGR